MTTLGKLFLLVVATANLSRAGEPRVMTFDVLPAGITFQSYTEDGIVLVGGKGTNRVSTALNPQNSTTAAEITFSNGRGYGLAAGGRLFSLQSLNVVVPVSGTAIIQSPSGIRTLTNGTSGVLTFDSRFENIGQVAFLVNPGSSLRFDDVRVVLADKPGFINWETPPIHPVALSPDGARLAVCNLPDNRLELFDVTSGTPVSTGSVPVGLDPVSVRWRTSNEVWVVNYISDSVSIVDAASMRIVATLNTLDTPADIVFAGSPQRAFVSCAMPNTVQVFDPVTQTAIAEVRIDGERPKAMAASPDGSKVYVAIFESGNASTILGPAITNGLGSNVVNDTTGPYGGRNPPPNSGANFNPPVNPNIPTNLPPPKVPHIVKKNAAGHWMDDNNGDWTEFVSGTNAALSGRRTGWDMPDHDLAVIDTATLGVSYATRLMNICMDVAVNPVSGQITVVGIDGINEVRFEPNLNGIFLRVQLARIDALTLDKTIHDLNPHLDYLIRTLPEAERNRSLGDPRGIVWNASGTRAYITGMGSGNLVTVDSSGNRGGPQPLALGEGPTGLALDEPRHRLYVLNRFSATISVVDTLAQTVVGTVPLFDPTPQVIKAGRKHLYDTHKTSGLGHTACASCHVDARMDRLAWDLGDPAGSVVRITNGSVDFHPMKGPMVTITFQDMIGHEPFHWRGDRRGLTEFSQTFTNLQAAAATLTTNEMKEFKEFLATIHFPPNPFREFNNTLATNVPLRGHFSIGGGALPKGAQLPNGNAFLGMKNVSFPNAGGCLECHSFPSGLAPDGANVPFGPDGEHNLGLVSHGRLGGIFLKPSQLRGLFEKTGLDFDSTNSRAGFGFSHHGNADTLTRFLQNAFPFVTGNDQRTADFVAFLLSFSGSDLPLAIPDFIINPVGLPSKDVPAAVGKQVTANSPASVPRIDEMLALANSPTSRIELIVRGPKDGLNRGWLYVPISGDFQSDRNAERISAAALRALAGSGNELTYTIVPEGTGRRIALDRDLDGFLDRDELDFPSDPANPASIPLHTVVTISAMSNLVTISWNSVSGKTYQVQFNNSLGLSAWSNLQSSMIASNTTSALSENMIEAIQRYYRVQILK